VATAFALIAIPHDTRRRPRIQPRCCTPLSHVTAKPNVTAPSAAALTLREVVSAAATRGVVLEDASTGPLMQLRARDAVTGANAGVISGVLLPGGRLHIESYKAARRDGKGGLLRLSPGMLLFIAAVAYGGQRGCTGVYGLAIDDAPDQHRRLVRYLKRFGGIEVRKVGETWKDIPDRLLYGGRGTIIRGDVESMRQRSSNMIRRTEVITQPLL
jgi:hypothetical protein